MENKLQINLKDGISKDNKPYKYIEVVIGDWTGRCFARSDFELKYIENYLKENK